MKVLVFLTDGQASKGVQDRNLILKNVEQTNTDGVAVFSLAFGKDADYEFVKKVAVKNKGVAREIFEDSDADLQIKGFYDEISSAALNNLSFKYLNDAKDISVNVTKQTFDTYFNGKELVVAGILPENEVKVLNLIVTEDGVLGQVELYEESDLKSRVPELTKTGDFAKITERIWAYLTIKQLLEKAIGENNENEKKRLNDQALDLSLQKDLKGSSLSQMCQPAILDNRNQVPKKSKPARLEQCIYNKFFAIRGPGSSGRLHFLRRPGGTQRNRGSSRRRGYSSGGGGGGDPHSMLRINGIVFPICFDVSAEEKDVLCILSDKISGQFVHKKTVLTETRVNSQGRIRGHFREVKGKKKTHFTATLHAKADVITGELVPCWTLFKNITGLIDGSIQQYFKSDANTI